MGQVALKTDTADIIKFPMTYQDEIKGVVKSENKPKRKTTMECLYNDDEIRDLYNIFKRQIEEANTLVKERTARRNLTMYVCAIEIGLRGGDFCSLKWSNIFNPDWTFNYSAEFVPQKTSKFGKHVDLIWGVNFEEAMSAWLAWKNIHVEQQKIDDYIFTSQKVHKDKRTGEIRPYIDSKAWYKIVESARKEAGIKQKIGTHGLRKTMVNQYIKLSDDKSLAMEEMSDYLGHADIRTTRVYSCIQRENIKQVKQRMICFNDDFYGKMEEVVHERNAE